MTARFCWLGSWHPLGNAGCPGDQDRCKVPPPANSSNSNTWLFIDWKAMEGQYSLHTKKNKKKRYYYYGGELQSFIHYKVTKVKDHSKPNIYIYSRSRQVEPFTDILELGRHLFASSTPVFHFSQGKETQQLQSMKHSHVPGYF